MDQQSTFETSVFEKTRKMMSQQENNILLLDDNIITFVARGDLHFYVVGSVSENEIILSAILTAITDSLDILLRGESSKTRVLENLDLVVLVYDEIIDNGLVLELDPETIAERVSMEGEGQGPGSPTGLRIGGQNIDLKNLNEDTIRNAVKGVRDSLIRNLLK